MQRGLGLVLDRGLVIELALALRHPGVRLLVDQVLADAAAFAFGLADLALLTLERLQRADHLVARTEAAQHLVDGVRRDAVLGRDALG